MSTLTWPEAINQDTGAASPALKSCLHVGTTSFSFSPAPKTNLKVSVGWGRAVQ
jgi:hypothetical protein